MKMFIVYQCCISKYDNPQKINYQPMPGEVEEAEEPYSDV